MNELFSITVDSTIEDGTHAKNCDVICTRRLVEINEI